MNRRVMYIRIQLPLDLHPVLKSEHQPSIVAGRGLLHHRQPGGAVELRNACLPLMQGEHGCTAGSVPSPLRSPGAARPGSCQWRRSW